MNISDRGRYNKTLPDRKIKEKKIVCGTCSGTGIIDGNLKENDKECPDCSGRGFYIERH